jgi:uncharacterized membrane protein YkvA (DUF1232 family)
MTRDYSAQWDDAAFDSQTAGKAARDEARVRRGFWVKVRRFAADLPFAEDLLAAYYCAFDHDTPVQVKAALLAALAYFVLPFDLMPDVMPLLGFSDDAAVLAAAIRMVAGAIRPEHYAAARDAIDRQARS